MKLLYQGSLFLSISVIIASCAVQHIDVSVAYPPFIKLPSHIKTLTVVNGSAVDSSQKSTDLILSVLTGEALGGDRLASEDCVQAFSNKINQSGEFQCLLPTRHLYNRSIFSTIPKKADWILIKKICRENHSDAVVMLEAFKTTSDATANTVKTITDIATGNGVGSYPIHFQITYYWRLYDTLSNTIYDEYGNVLSQVFYSGAPFQPLPVQPVRNSGIYLGEQYAFRFLKNYYWEPREFYKKGNTDFETARRRALVNDWSGAMKLWGNYTESSNQKMAGRACFNMAVGNEVLGQLEQAKMWAQKAYADYGNKKARNYLYTLEHRPQN